MKKLLVVIMSLAIVLVIGCSKASLKDGTMEINVTGHNAPIDITMTIEGGKLINIETEHLETIGIGNVALEMLSAEIIEKQTVGIDAITGATITSWALLSGVEKALEQNGADMEMWTASGENYLSENEIIETDIVIIGGGGSGLAAAISAEQNGANVIVLEKLGFLGGSTNISEGALNAVDERRQKSQGIEDSVEKFYTQTLDGGYNVGTPELVKVMTDNAYSAVEWMESIGVKFKDEVGTATGALWQRSHYPTTPSGNSYIRVFEDYVENSDGRINVITDADAQKILTDENGRAIGVEAINRGRKITVNASKAVIIATGGFGSNIELRNEVNTGVWSHVNLNSAIGCTNLNPAAQGDGIIMAQEVGAALTGMADLQIHPCGHPKTGLMVDLRTSGRNRIFVNEAGERFVNEGAARDILANAIFDQQGSTYWIVVNSIRYPDRTTPDSNGSTIENMVALGNVIEADTLEELASLTGMDYEKLQASIDTYNSVVRKEIEKDELGFEANNVADTELLEGPWYAGKKVPSVHHTMGGVQINANTEVLNAEGQVIDALYAAGEVTGGIHGTNRLGGNAIADCMVFGKIAGLQAANN